MALSDPRPRNPRSVLSNDDGPHPQCFNSASEYHQWLFFLQLSNETLRVGFCIDCTPEYKMEMLRQDRCEHPETQFIVLREKNDANEVSLAGVSSASVFWARVERGAAVIDEVDDGQDQQQGKGQDGRTRTYW